MKVKCNPWIITSGIYHNINRILRWSHLKSPLRFAYGIKPQNSFRSNYVNTWNVNHTSARQSKQELKIKYTFWTLMVGFWTRQIFAVNPFKTDRLKLSYNQLMSRSSYFINYSKNSTQIFDHCELKCREFLNFVNDNLKPKSRTKQYVNRILQLMGNSLINRDIKYQHIRVCFFKR